ncbi:hypothetical protein M409DRAFT_16772 [Zasmidium cellare ATCC 36951]|uniref:NmrA-like domain-containing protein n=1 Tax=Zasmidium cellare ATCC 36951 TaxID=1080233 RepID=A0A6A6D3Q1_ZASCE|nr:uncharacterized protein M409DRAFT_16772 [Zasmidium cellare ATCC 36951]KAF2172812.1 hypothetical protein M409DRAFT_16772 [Zasmidium cellare ATCC 36951]
MPGTLSVLLVGAGGAWGRPLLEQFIKQKSSFKRVAVLARDQNHAEKFSDAKAQGVEIVLGSFLDSAPYKGFDVVMSLVGNPLLRLQPAMIQAASAAGVTHFYPGEWNSDIDQPEIANMRYFRDKQATRAQCHATAQENPNFKYTIFITGIFTEWTLMFGWDHEKKSAVVFGDSSKRIGSTSIPDIARYTVDSLLIPFKADGGAFPNRRTIRAQGGSKPYGELVADLEEARGMKYSVEYRDRAEALKLQEQARQQGDEAGEMFWSIRTLPASGYGVADGVEEGKLDNDLFDFTPETQKETFERFWSGQK